LLVNPNRIANLVNFAIFVLLNIPTPVSQMANEVILVSGSLYTDSHQLSFEVQILQP